MEYTALYRRFRPMKFSEVLGQEHITQTLKNQVIANRVGHAYLFTGSRGCGKTSTAKILSRAVNCLHPKDGEPCNECEVCKAALDGSLTDIVEMDAASNNGVDDIRAIRDEVNFLPTVAKYRVYIIDEVHMLSAGAFNALLKTLEEPPEHVKFILATTEPQKLPATILSRCQRFDFKKIAPEFIIENLQKVCQECDIKYEDGALNLIAELSEGGMRDALSILERCAQDGENNISEEKIKELVGIPKTVVISEIIESIINYDEKSVLNLTKQVLDDGKDPENILFELIKYTRDLMVLKTTQTVSNVYNEEDVKKMNEIISKASDEKLLKIIYSLSELENEVKFSSQKSIVFQVGLIKECVEESKTLEERIKTLEDKINSGNIRVNNSNSFGSGTGVSTNRAQNVQNSSSKISRPANKTSNVVASSGTGKKSESFWNDIIDKLKEERMPMLYSNLLNTKGVILDDMTFGIEFPNGLNSFGRSIIEKPENMAELKKLVSVECKKDMRIKLIDDKNLANSQAENTEDKKASSAESLQGLGIDINVVD